eukprot:scaffold2113_cov233-Pinguiococcus_pyrenoidosus.AAC.7
MLLRPVSVLLVNVLAEARIIDVPVAHDAPKSLFIARLGQQLRDFFLVIPHARPVHKVLDDASERRDLFLVQHDAVSRGGLTFLLQLLKRILHQIHLATQREWLPVLLPVGIAEIYETRRGVVVSRELPRRTECTEWAKMLTYILDLRREGSVCARRCSRGPASRPSPSPSDAGHRGCSATSAPRTARRWTASAARSFGDRRRTPAG